MTPGMMRSVTFASMSSLPYKVDTSTSSPSAKGNPQHSNYAQIAKAR